MGLPGGSDSKEPACNVRHLVGKIPWRREWLPTAVFWPGELHGQRSLAGHSPWGRKELDMASPTQWTWVWVNSGSWWWMGRPGVLQSMGPQRVRHKWATELNWATFTFFTFYNYIKASLVAQMVKNLPAVQETWVWSLDWEDPLEKGVATHSSILAYIYIYICLFTIQCLNGKKKCWWLKDWQTECNRMVQLL